MGGRGAGAGWRERESIISASASALHTGLHTGRHCPRLFVALGFDLLLCDLISGLFARPVEALLAPRRTGSRPWVGVPVELATGLGFAPSAECFCLLQRVPPS